MVVEKWGSAPEKLYGLSHLPRIGFTSTPLIKVLGVWDMFHLRGRKKIWKEEIWKEEKRVIPQTCQNYVEFERFYLYRPTSLPNLAELLLIWHGFVVVFVQIFIDFALKSIEFARISYKNCPKLPKFWAATPVPLLIRIKRELGKFTLMAVWTCMEGTFPRMVWGF